MKIIFRIIILLPFFFGFLPKILAQGGTTALPAQKKAIDAVENADDTRYVSTSYTVEQLKKLVPVPKPEDVATPEAIVKALHQSVDGPKGDWNSDRLRSLCLPSVSFTYVDQDEKGIAHVKTISLDSFIKEVTQVHKVSAWYEDVSEIHVNKIEKKNHTIAEAVYSGWVNTVTGKEGESSGKKGEATAELIYLGNRWWVVSHTW